MASNRSRSTGSISRRQSPAPGSGAPKALMGVREAGRADDLAGPLVVAQKVSSQGRSMTCRSPGRPARVSVRGPRSGSPGNGRGRLGGRLGGLRARAAATRWPRPRPSTVPSRRPDRTGQRRARPESHGRTGPRETCAQGGRCAARAWGSCRRTVTFLGYPPTVRRGGGPRPEIIRRRTGERCGHVLARQAPPRNDALARIRSVHAAASNRRGHPYLSA